ncbi:hypothetical cytosolic protein [Syntrophus aciditrophicus SB]|uniref:Hypothetical cytosolic protein n=1 Tax=Syntrophus aciditrophicus (strain SB) TaxID=56780 RepID=Q2LVJ4_SYNAS|nr:hypothetical cytosolic protein [Syntrophus aciditrophicus SB]
MDSSRNETALNLFLFIDDWTWSRLFSFQCVLEETRIFSARPRDMGTLKNGYVYQRIRNFHSILHTIS